MSDTPSDLRAQLHDLIRRFVAQKPSTADSRSMPLVSDTIGAEEISAVLDTMLDGHITMGPRLRRLEAEWSRWLGVPDSVMVNSGSSANLLALAAAALPDLPSGLRPGDEVLVPAVGWSTTIYPIAQAGLLPVLVDCDPWTLDVSLEQLQAAMSPRTRGIVVVHLLGNPCAMDKIAAFARDRGLFLMEDCCEAHGAEIAGKKVGTFGDLSTFSFFFSHHITTGEGGMVSMRDPSRWADRVRSLRAHGWIRERSDREQIIARNPGIDPRWLFVSQGYNVRSTDMNAAIGLVQLQKLDGFIRRRRQIRQRMLDGLAGLGDRIAFQQEQPGGQHSAFAFAMLLRPGVAIERKDFAAGLEAAGIETRPVVTGNLARQPVLQHMPHRIAGKLPHADFVHDRGLMVGIHPNTTDAQVAHMVATVQKLVGGLRAPASSKAGNG